MMTYTGFGEYSHEVKAMVEKDDKVICDRFYGNMTKYVRSINPLICVDFDMDFKDAERKLFFMNHDTCKLMFQIMLLNIIDSDKPDEEGPCSFKNMGTHAVVAVKDVERGDIAFFDPNGIIEKKDGIHLYCMEDDKIVGGTKELKARWKRIYNSKNDKKLYFPKEIGIQMVGPSTNSTKYIADGGYCMFYGGFFIEYIANIFTNVFNSQADKTIEYINKEILNKHGSSLQSKMFPSKNNTGVESVAMVKRYL
jgi:hypothetical protein